MSYKVFVDDNSRYMDEPARYEKGEYDSYAAAVAACEAIVNQYLSGAFKAGMSADDLFGSYISFGEDPFITPEPEGFHFSARDYARKRCSELFGAT